MGLYRCERQCGPCGETVLVTDPSIVVTALADDGHDGVRVRTRLAGEMLAAPELLDLEVASVLRGLSRSKELTVRRAERALADLMDLDIRRIPHRPLLPRCWELRENLSVYDASYVALAEALDAVLLTGDRRLGRAAGVRCVVEVL